MWIMVAMYPFVGDRERDAALARIAARHQRRADSRWSEAGADGDDPARDVLAHLRRHHTRVPRDVAAADAGDELVLAAWVWWDERRRERELLARARSYGHSLGELGAFLGLATRQAAYEYLDRLDALLAAHRSDQDRQHRAATDRTTAQQTADGLERDPAAVAGPHGTAGLPAGQDLYRRTRGRRPSAVGADPTALRQRRRDQRARPARDQWIDDHHTRIDQIVSELIAQCARIGIDAAEQESEDFELEDTLAVLYRHRRDQHYSHASFGALGLTLGELRTHPVVTDLSRNHGVHRAIAAAGRLRADYAALGPTR